MPDNVGAMDDTAGVNEDSGPNLVDVLANDEYPAGATITAVTQGSIGSVAITPDNLAVTYTPDPNANGADTFTCHTWMTAWEAPTPRRSTSSSPPRTTHPWPLTTPPRSIPTRAPTRSTSSANDSDVDGPSPTIVRVTDGTKRVGRDHRRRTG